MMDFRAGRPDFESNSAITWVTGFEQVTLSKAQFLSL